MNEKAYGSISSKFAAAPAVSGVNVSFQPAVNGVVVRIMDGYRETYYIAANEMEGAQHVQEYFADKKLSADAQTIATIAASPYAGLERVVSYLEKAGRLRPMPTLDESNDL
jgi:hypothetical protein